MKSINNYISEALIKKDTKIKTSIINQLGYNESLLNIDIKSMDHLKEVLSEYFKPYSKHNINILHIPKICRKKNLKYNQFTYFCQDIFVIEFCKIGEGPIKKLYIGQSDEGILMQICLKNFGTEGSFTEGVIIGRLKDKLDIGDNLLNWLNKLKNRAITHDAFVDRNLVKTFFGNVDNIQEALITKDTKLKTHITKKDIRDFLNEFLSKASSGLIKALQNEESQWYNPSEIDQKIYELDSTKSYIKDLMEYTAQKLNITFDELWDLCNHSSFVFRAIILKQNPQR